MDTKTLHGLSLLQECGITEVPPINLGRGTWEFGIDATQTSESSPAILWLSQSMNTTGRELNDPTQGGMIVVFVTCVTESCHEHVNPLMHGTF